MKKSILIFAIALFAVIAFAQPDPNVIGAGNPGIQPGQPGINIDYNKIQSMMLDNAMNQSELLIEVSDSGIFIYKAGRLAKLDYFTLKLLKKIELFGPMPDKPAPPAQKAGIVGWGAMLQDKDNLKYIEEINKRIAQTTIIPEENALIFIIGENFFKVNTNTMNIDLQTNFSKKIATAQQFQIDNLRGVIGGASFQPNYLKNNQGNNVIAKTKDNMLVFIKQDEIIVIDTLTGKIIARTAVPQDFISKPINYQVGPIIGGPIMQPGQPIGQPAPGQPFIQPGGKNPNVQPGNNVVQAPAGLIKEQDMTFLAGTVKMSKGFPVLECDAGEVYILTGPKVTELTDKIKLNKKYRLMGKISREKAPPFGIGYFDVFSYLELNGV